LFRSKTVKENGEGIGRVLTPSTTYSNVNPSFLRSGVNLSLGGNVNLEWTKKELGRTYIRSGVNPSLGGNVNPERTKKKLGRTCVGRLERT
jgi:hypothetical protein